jgi:hypothetical protein
LFSYGSERCDRTRLGQEDTLVEYAVPLFVLAFIIVGMVGAVVYARDRAWRKQTRYPKDFWESGGW